MPRNLQGNPGNRGYPASTGKGGKSGGKAGKAEEDAAIAIDCMGEAGRDHLCTYFGDSPLAEKIVKAIDEEGYVVLPQVFSGEEMDVELDRAWDFVQRVSPTVKRDDWNTWWGQRSPDPWPHAQRDMLQLHQAGWVFSEVRERFAERVFEPLYGTKELHVSKDGFTFQRPTNKELGRTPNDHFDQGNRWMGLQCIQGSVALTDQTENDGCFKVWPGSHTHREEILSHPKHRKAAQADFIIIHDDDKDLLRERGIEARRVPVKKGDVVLWRSDVCHCGAPPLGRCDTYRAVVYVCCLPAALTPEPVYYQKRRAFERLETGCHYPNREEWFEVVERHRRISWRPYFTAPPKLTQRQQELYGLVRYGELAAKEQSGGSTSASSGGGAEAAERREEATQEQRQQEKSGGGGGGGVADEGVSGDGVAVADPVAYPSLSAAAPAKPARRWAKR